MLVKKMEKILTKKRIRRPENAPHQSVWLAHSGQKIQELQETRQKTRGFAVDQA